MSVLDDVVRRGKSWLAKLVLPFSSRMYWNLRADDIFERWGDDAHDHELITTLLDRLEPRTLLDVGCGAGRLFPLYYAHGVRRVVGQDVSRRALRRAGRRFPSQALTLVDQDLASLDFAPGYFDLAICNRVLSAIHPNDISAALERLVTLCRHLYLNEYSKGEGGQPSKYWFLHDYFALLDRLAEYTVLETGRISSGTYHLIRIDAVR